MNEINDMAEMSYPPWSASAPTTLDRDRKSKQNKWTNFRNAIKKPRERKSVRKSHEKKNNDRSALPPPAGVEDTTSFRPMRFGEFSPFGPGRQKINPLSGAGNPFLFHQLTGGGAFPNYPQPFRPYTEDRSYEKEQSEEGSPKGMFSPPTPKPSRPALSNIFPMYNSPQVSKTLPSKPVKPSSGQPPRPVSKQRRNSTPAVNVAPQHILKHRPSFTSAQSTTSDVTAERAGRRERRASAIRALPMLLTSDLQRSSSSSVHGREKERDFTNKELPSDAMYHTPPTLAGNGEGGVIDSSAMYGWSQQPHEQLQKLEEELESEGPEGEPEDTGILSMERERVKEPPTKLKGKGKSNKESAKPKEEQVSDFTGEFVRQLTLGDSGEDVLY